MGTVGLVSFLRSFAIGAAVAGCAALAGLEDPGTPGESEVKNPTRDPVEAGVDATTTEPPPSTCTPTIEPAATDGVHHAAAWEGPEPTIDGAFDDWACVPRRDLGKGSWTTASFPAEAKAEVAFRHTPGALYFYASITTTTPGFENAQGFANDSINLYLGPPNPTAAFRPSDHQFAFDHEGKVSHYINGTNQPLPASVKASMRVRTEGTLLVFEVEARFEPKVFPNVPAFERGQTFTLGLQLHDRIPTDSGVGRIEWRNWFRSPACGCNTADSICCSASTGNKNLIACDFRCTGSLALD